jgi:hypothetical protein
MWYGGRPNLSNIRVIGAKAWALKPSNQRPKLVTDKATECQLLGFEGQTIYRLLTMEGKVIRSSNVHFDENAEAPPAKWLKQTTPEPVPAKELTHNTAAAKLPRSVAGENMLLDLNLLLGRQDQDPLPQTMADQTVGIEAQDTSPSSRTLTPGENGPSPTQQQDTDTLGGTFDDQNQEEEKPEPPPYHAPLRRSARTTQGQSPHRYQYGFVGLPNEYGFISLLDDREEPKSYKEATQSHRWEQWQTAMKDELNSLTKNGTWEFVNKPKDRSALRGKWVYKLKRGPNGEVVRHKARLVVKGFSQQEGIDYDETFAAVVKPMTYKTLFAIATDLDWEIEQMDVKTAFLYGDIDHETFVEQPTGFTDGSNKVCRLRKALYGLKQSPRIWYQTLATFLQSKGFRRLHSDYSVFTNSTTFILIYVDDILLMGPSKEDIDRTKRELHHKFEMTDLGPCTYCHGMTKALPRDAFERFRKGLGLEVVGA